MFKSSIFVLENISSDKTCKFSQRGDADAALNLLIFYDFVFIAHLMIEILKNVNTLCKALQQKSQNIISALKMVSTTKRVLQTFREDGWHTFIEKVKLFCEQHDILIPNIDALYVACKGRARHQEDQVTIGHYYRVEVFYVTINTQLHELNNRFNDQAIELLTLASLLEPKDGFKDFDIDRIFILAEKYYPMDFTSHERFNLRSQLQHFLLEAKDDPNLGTLSSLSELCQQLVEIGDAKIYFLVDRLIRLILTLPVSTATTERAFLAMKIVKTRLCNKMSDDFLADSLVIYIERQIIKTYIVNEIIEDFKVLKERRALL
ncbi:unnamed protein product [Amaranthus hypochondriacus]